MNQQADIAARIFAAHVGSQYYSGDSHQVDKQTSFAIACAKQILEQCDPKYNEDPSFVKQDNKLFHPTMRCSESLAADGRCYNCGALPSEHKDHSHSGHCPLPFKETKTNPPTERQALVSAIYSACNHISNITDEYDIVSPMLQGQLDKIRQHAKALL